MITSSNTFGNGVIEPDSYYCVNQGLCLGLIGGYDDDR